MMAAADAVPSDRASSVAARFAPPVEGLTAVTTGGEWGARAAASNSATAEDRAASPDVTAGASAGRLGDSVEGLAASPDVATGDSARGLGAGRARTPGARVTC